MQLSVWLNGGSETGQADRSNESQIPCICYPNALNRASPNCANLYKIDPQTAEQVGRFFRIFDQALKISITGLTMTKNIIALSLLFATSRESKRILLPIIATCLLALQVANADDSIARVAAGGIEFQKSDDIRMTYEELDISTDAVQVNFQFLNTSDRDISSTVAFPMPPYRFNPGFSEWEMNNKPLKSFKLKVNDLEIKTQDDRRAMIQGKDVTRQLRDLGLTDAQIFDTFTYCADGQNMEHCGITKSQELAIEKLGDWQVYETAYWQQDFPSHKKISVFHEYVPFLGKHYFAGYQGAEYLWDAASDVCEDEGARQAVEKQVKSLVKGGAKSVTVFVDEVEYILKTGKNWGGRIDDFHLRLIKKTPSQVVSVCFPGKARVLDSRTIELSQKNYVPPDELRVNFYSVVQQP